MKRKVNQLWRRYASALRKHLNQGPRATFQAARGLGRQAVSLGLETLDVARMHEGALGTLKAALSPNGFMKRAEIFFTEAVMPIEKTHSASVKAHAQFSRVHKKLDRRLVDLAISKKSLKENIVRRKSVEGALEKSGGQSKELLNKSHRLQDHLRNATHRLLTTQEDKRKKTSHDLQDEVAQTLLGINVRLLTLGKEAELNAKNLGQAIDSTQRLVERSAKNIKRFAREVGKPYET